MLGHGVELQNYDKWYVHMARLEPDNHRADTNIKCETPDVKALDAACTQTS